MTDLACTAVTWDGNAANAHTGSGSIYGTFDFTGSLTAQGLVYYNLAAFPINLTGKTLNVWVNIPVAIANQGYGIQVVAKTPGWNAQWINITASGWQLFSFDVDKAGTVNAAGITEVGVMISRNNSAVAYSGPIQIDDVTITNSPDPNLYDFESATVEGWSVISGYTVGLSASTDHAFTGSYSLKADMNYTATGGASVGIAGARDITGKWIYVRVWVPLTYPGYKGGKIYVKSGGTWTTVEGPEIYFAAGTWTELRFDGSTATDPADVKEIGINMWNDAFAGAIYFDTIQFGAPFVEGQYHFDTAQTANFYGQNAATSLSWDSTVGYGTPKGSMRVNGVFSPVNSVMNIVREIPATDFSGKVVTIRIKAPDAVLDNYTGSTDVYMLGIHVQNNTTYAEVSGGYVALTRANDTADGTTDGWISTSYTVPAATTSIFKIYYQVYKGSAVPTDADGTGNWYFDDITW